MYLDLPNDLYFGTEEYHAVRRFVQLVPMHNGQPSRFRDLIMIPCLLVHFSLKQSCRGEQEGAMPPNLKLRRLPHRRRALHRVAPRHGTDTAGNGPARRLPSFQAACHRPAARRTSRRRRLLHPPRRRVRRGRRRVPACCALLGAHVPCYGTPWREDTCRRRLEAGVLRSGRAARRARHGVERGCLDRCRRRRRRVASRRS
jgi:hypothetical protein